MYGTIYSKKKKKKVMYGTMYYAEYCFLKI